MSLLTRSSMRRWHASAQHLCSRCLAPTSLSLCTARRFAHSHTKAAVPPSAPSPRRRRPPAELFPSVERPEASASSVRPPPPKPSARRTAAALSSSVAPATAHEAGVSLIDLLRPERLSASEPPSPPSPPPQPAPAASAATVASPVSSSPHPATAPPTLLQAQPPNYFAPSPSPSSDPSLESLDDAEEKPDEEYQRYRTEPLLSPPSFDEVEEQVDSLLDVEFHGHKMFPAYMRPQLKLLSLRHIQSVLTAHFNPASHPPAPLTAHGLHTRLFTHVVKHASKLARTEEERIAIVCPDAPRVGAKVSHPQWPEVTTVMKRYFTAEREWESMQVDEERLRAQGKVRLSELFSGLDSEQVKLGPEDSLIDIDELDEAALTFEGEKEPPPPTTMSKSQHDTWQAQREAREQAKMLMRNRIRALKAKRAAAKAGLGEPVFDPVMTKEGLIRELAVVYRFDGSGEEFELRYPLSRRDQKKLDLFDEDDDAETVIE